MTTLEIPSLALDVPQGGAPVGSLGIIKSVAGNKKKPVAFTTCPGVGLRAF